MPRLIGFSTGALAFGAYDRGLAEVRAHALGAVELSALRQPELEPLVDAIHDLDLSGFQYIAFHAPSEIAAGTERRVVELLLRIAERGWPIVVHPNVIADYSLWNQMGSALCIENMDKRKPIGRTATEIESLLERLPKASLCFDIGHARQIDSTMTEAYFILSRFGTKLRQVHVSEVNTRSQHDALSFASMLAFRSVAEMIPADVPLIVESVVQPSQIDAEIERVREAFPVVEAVVGAHDLTRPAGVTPRLLWQPT
jgi:hypothetical protein